MLILVVELVLKAVRFAFLIGLIKKIKLAESLRMVFETAMFVTYTPGKSGEVTKLDILKQKHGVRRTDTFAVLVFERVYDLAVVIAFSIGVLFTLGLDFYPVLIVLAILPIAVLVMYKIGIFRATISRVLASIKRIGDKKNIIVAGMLTLLIWLTDALIPYFTLMSLGYNIPFPELLSFYYASVLVGLLSMIPGGLGSTEFSFSLILSKLAGVEAAHAAITIIIERVVAFIVCIGGVLLYFDDYRKALGKK
jgi:uncharacterized membrane protein YbhN (UPF0104 family)